jgi:tetratricopeptide (TPR) repeat protein
MKKGDRMEDETPAVFPVVGDDGELINPLGKRKRKRKPVAAKWWLAAGIALVVCIGAIIGIQLSVHKPTIEATVVSLTAQESNNRGVTSKANGDYKAAVADFTHALEEDSQYEDAYNNRGITYYLMGENDLAMADFNKAIELNPQDAKVYNNRGELYYRRFHNDDQALADFKRCLELDPQYALAYNNQGNVYNDVDRGAYAESIPYYDRAIELQADYYEAYTNRANAFLRLGELDKAYQDATRSIEINPQFARAYAVRGAVEVTRADVAPALDDFRAFIRLAGDDENPQTINKIHELIRDLEASLEVTPEVSGQ